MNEQSSHHASGVSRRILLILSLSVVLQSLKEQHDDHDLRKKQSQWKESSESGRELFHGLVVANDCLISRKAVLNLLSLGFL